MKNNIKIIALSISSLLLIVACTNQPVSDESAVVKAEMPTENPDLINISSSQFAAAKMELGQIMEQPFSTTIKANGMLDVPPKSMAAVSPYIGGYMQNINLLPGQKVNKGQVLFYLENPAYIQMQQDYLEAKEQLNYLKTDYERQKTLANENIVAQKNYLKAETEYRVTLTRYESLKKKLALIHINPNKVSIENLVTRIPVHAPISGYITEVNSRKGQFLNPTEVAVQITNTDHLHLELNVFEKDVLKLKKGQNISFKVPDASDEKYEAMVYLVGKTVDGEKRTINVHGHLKEEENKQHFVVGMYIEAEIAIAESSANCLPETAVVSVEDQNYVLVVKEENSNGLAFEKKEVQIGQSQNGMIEIKNSNIFSEEERILMKGAFNLIVAEE